MGDANCTPVWSIGTAVPSQRIEQDHVLAFMQRYYKADKRLQRRLKYLYRRSHIAQRYTCCADFNGAQKPGEESLFGAEEPGTEKRMRVYGEQITGLAEAACRNALAGQAGLVATDVTHLIMVTCTGFYAPGPDVDLVEVLGLRPQVQRLQIGFMGCQAALQGLQVADAICRSNSQAVVLLVCAELCTLHFQSEPTEENLIINSLFGDGAAAVLLGGSAASKPLCRMQNFSSFLVPQTREMVTWHIGDRGYRMGLALTAPAVIRQSLPDFVDRLLAGATLRRDEIDLWAIHPGGRSILDAVERVLDLDPQYLVGARAILSNYGNMSSATVLFVLKKVLHEAQDGQRRGVALTFGPGLSLEGLTWVRG